MVNMPIAENIDDANDLRAGFKRGGQDPISLPYDGRADRPPRSWGGTTGGRPFLVAEFLH
jgi:hypothetical protein